MYVWWQWTSEARSWSCEFISLQLDKSANVCHASRLLLLIQMVVSDGSIKKDLRKTVPLYGKTRGEDIFQNLFWKWMFPFINLCKSPQMAFQPWLAKMVANWALQKRSCFPWLFSYHCVIYLQALCTKVINFQHVVGAVWKNCKLEPC